MGLLSFRCDRTIRGVSMVVPTKSLLLFSDLGVARVPGGPRLVGLLTI